MKIKMLTTRRTSQDGYVVKEFEAGKIYDNVAEATARRFICLNQAVEIIEPADELFNCFKSSDINEQLAALEKLA